MSKPQHLTGPNGQKIVFHSRIEFNCPFCNLLVECGEVEDNVVGSDGGTNCLMHQAPHCKNFDEMDPLTFIRAARVSQQQKRLN